MKRLISIPFIIGIIVLCGCSHSDDNSQSMNSRTKSLSELKQLIVDSGDTNAYNDLSIQLLDYRYGDEDLLPYALIMANTYDYEQAYFDVFLGLIDPFLSDINKMDAKTAQMAIEYLLLAADKGHGQASEMVDSYHINKDSLNPVEQIRAIYIGEFTPSPTSSQTSL